MYQNNTQIDWAKAAAAWVYQKKDVPSHDVKSTVPNPANIPHLNNPCSIPLNPQQNLNPALLQMLISSKMPSPSVMAKHTYSSHSIPGIRPYTSIGNPSMMNLPTMANTGGRLLPAQQLTCQPSNTFNTNLLEQFHSNVKLTSPYCSDSIQNTSCSGIDINTKTIPKWFYDIVCKPDDHSEIGVESKNNDSTQTIVENELKLPEVNENELIPIPPLQDELIFTIKSKFIQIMKSVTRKLVQEIASNTLHEAKIANVQSLGIPKTHHVGQTSQEPFPTHYPNVSLPIMMQPVIAAPPTHMQMTMNTKRFSGQLPMDPLKEIDEETVDDRDTFFNNNLPFVNTGGYIFSLYMLHYCSEPTRGLFKQPADSVILPQFIDLINGASSSSAMSQDATIPLHLRKSHTLSDTVVKVIIYSKNGKMLDELFLNGRSHIVFGSSPNQAHILDSHTSVYSQHCAIAICTKARTSTLKTQYDLPLPCALFLFPLGGSLKIVSREAVPFLQESKVVLDPSTDQNKPEDATAPQENPIQLITESERRRELSIGSQTYLQLGSSHRYYLIDSSRWNKTFILVDKQNESQGRFMASSSMEKYTSEMEKEVQSLNKIKDEKEIKELNEYKSKKRSSISESSSSSSSLSSTHKSKNRSKYSNNSRHASESMNRSSSREKSDSNHAIGIRRRSSHRRSNSGHRSSSRRRSYNWRSSSFKRDTDRHKKRKSRGSSGDYRSKHKIKEYKHEKTSSHNKQRRSPSDDSSEVNDHNRNYKR